MNHESRKELITAAEAADRLKITKRTILKWASVGRIERGKISGKMVFTAEAIENLLKQKTNEVEFQTRGNQHALRTASSSQSIRKGGACKKSGEFWLEIRQELRHSGKTPGASRPTGSGMRFPKKPEEIL